MTILPKFITKYFWGDDTKELSIKRHKKYISSTILEKGDLKAFRWLTSKVSQKQLKKVVAKLKNPKSKNFWRLYF
jgi:hypothetical protein